MGEMQRLLLKCVWMVCQEEIAAIEAETAGFEEQIDKTKPQAEALEAIAAEVSAAHAGHTHELDAMATWYVSLW